MKIAHFVNVTPKQCGMYESVRDLCMAECELGHEAKMIDTIGINAQSPTSRLERGCEIANNTWAKDADVHVLHSQIPDELFGTKPIVVVLHGPPEYVFYSELHEHEKGDGGFRTLLLYDKKPMVKKFVTFWDRHVPFWEAVFGDGKVSYVPAPVNPSDYQPEGDKYGFSTPGKPNIIFCDTWRTTFNPRKDPFQMIIGMRLFWKKFQEARLQIFGIPGDNVRTKTWGGVYDEYILAVRRQGNFFGVFHEMFDNMPIVYRAADIVLTNSITAERIVRESLSCGTPIVAPHSNKYTPYTCDTNYPETIAAATERAWNDLQADREKVKLACIEQSKQFCSQNSAIEFIKVLESIK